MWETLCTTTTVHKLQKRVLASLKRATCNENIIRAVTRLLATVAGKKVASYIYKYRLYNEVEVSMEFTIPLAVGSRYDKAV